MKTLRFVLASLLLLASGLFLAAPSNAAVAGFSYANMTQITTDNGKPSQWSTRVSPPTVKAALKNSWLRNRINKPNIEGRIKREAIKFNVPLSQARDWAVCDHAFAVGGKGQERCYDELDGRYDRYLDFMDNNGLYVVWVNKGQAIRSLDGPGH